MPKIVTTKLWYEVKLRTPGLITLGEVRQFWTGAQGIDIPMSAEVQVRYSDNGDRVTGFRVEHEFDDQPVPVPLPEAF